MAEEAAARERIDRRLNEHDTGRRLRTTAEGAHRRSVARKSSGTDAHGTGSIVPVVIHGWACSAPSMGWVHGSPS